MGGTPEVIESEYIWVHLQVGSTTLDAAYWGKPEQMTMARPASVISATSPGSDLLGATAAALAATAMVFKSSDPAYAATLTSTARTLYT